MWSTEQTDLHAAQLYERIAARLAADVRSGALAPGQRLPGERDLARTLGVGRSSVREAIASLQVEGVVVTRPGSGTYVAPNGAERALALAGDGVHPPPRAGDASPSAVLEARALLEPRVAALAARRGTGPDPEAERLLAAMEGIGDAGSPTGRLAWNDADRLFHRQLAVMTANPVLAALAEHVAGVMDQPLWQRLRDDSVAVEGRMRLHVAEHRMIYEAVVGGDAAAAEFYASEHITRVRRYMTLD